MLLMFVLAEIETAVVADASKVAVSVLAFGTASGIQFAAVFQSPVAASGFH